MFACGTIETIIVTPEKVVKKQTTTTSDETKVVKKTFVGKDTEITEPWKGEEL